MLGNALLNILVVWEVRWHSSFVGFLVIFSLCLPQIFCEYFSLRYRIVHIESIMSMTGKDKFKYGMKIFFYADSGKQHNNQRMAG